MSVCVCVCVCVYAYVCVRMHEIPEVNNKGGDGRVEKGSHGVAVVDVLVAEVVVTFLY